MVQLTNILAAIVFASGAIGFITRRNAIVMILCAEFMLQAVTLNFATASAIHRDYGGQVLAIMVITVAACEAGLALVLILTLFHRRGTLDISRWSQLGEEVLAEDYEEPKTPDQRQLESQPQQTLIL